MHEYMSAVRIWELTCPGRPEEIGRVRRWVRDILTGVPRVDDAVLIVSELGTNAVVHTASGLGNFRLVIAHSPDILTISVTDAGGAATRPQVVRPDEGTPSGRGLGMVHAYATRLEIHNRGRSHTVTAELDLTDGPL
ncbi:ATP-binding protein [Streptomyces sp. XM4011]|nr:ATP-binding protein [Streptomyces sp. XM4011]MCK1817815.1 ATP-binding protein [Streptomyces sp. XM4011]